MIFNLFYQVGAIDSIQGVSPGKEIQGFGKSLNFGDLDEVKFLVELLELDFLGIVTEVGSE